MEIRDIRPEEANTWLLLRQALWPDSTREDLEREQREIREDPARNAVFVAVLPGDEVAGFVEVSIRDWAEGCATRPVGYIEGWYVRPGHRRMGIGRQLVKAAEDWALSTGCTEMGSDADLWNEASQLAHRALGYSEVGRAVMFGKKLANEEADNRQYAGSECETRATPD